jgi:hypothetical protein
VLSYAFLLFAEGPVEGAWLVRLQHADELTLTQWTNTQMLAQTPGLIYGTELGSKLPHRLKVFDPRENTWRALTNCPPIDPRHWDVEGDVVAFKHYQEEGYADTDISIRRLPDFSVVAEISVTNASHSQSGWDLKRSPDGTKLAVLAPLHEIRAPLRGSSYPIVGTTCALVAYDLPSGSVAGIAPRKALWGLCWLPDSRRVLFTSLRNEALLELTQLEKGWKKIYPGATPSFSNASTYVYDVATGSVEYFGEMKSPQLAAEAGQLVYPVEPDRLCTTHLASGQTNEIQVGRFGSRDLAVSPDGRYAVVYLLLTNPMAYLGYPTMADLNDPSKRHYVGGFSYRLDGTTDKGRPSQ